MTDATEEPQDLPATTRTALMQYLADKPALRKKLYTWFAVIALLVSFGPDIVVAGVLTEDAVPVFSAYIGLASSVLLKIGTALGFVASSNISQEH